MENNADKKRETITLAWRRESGMRQLVTPTDDYVECSEPAPAPSVKVFSHRSRIPVVELAGMPDDEFERRMHNWRRTVFFGGAGPVVDGCCASWARLYVARQLQLESDARIAAGVPPLPCPPRVSVDELDGWLVEAAVRALPSRNERIVLQRHHVWHWPEHWIKRELLLRKTAVRFVLATAQKNLKIILRKPNSAAIIQSNNLHAGVDPRPESKDAPCGERFDSEKEQALID